MKHINPPQQKIISDDDLSQKLGELGYSSLDIGKSWKEKRTVTEDGTIIDTVTCSGEPGAFESWQIEGPQETAIKNAREIKRQKDISDEKRFETI